MPTLKFFGCCSHSFHSFDGMKMPKSWESLMNQDILYIQISPPYFLNNWFYLVCSCWCWFQFEDYYTDRLEIRDGYRRTSRLLKRLHGSEGEYPVRSSSNVLYLQFITDSSGTSKGFLATYTSRWLSHETLSLTQCVHILVNPHTCASGYFCKSIYLCKRLFL